MNSKITLGEYLKEKRYGDSSSASGIIYTSSNTYPSVNTFSWKLDLEQVKRNIMYKKNKIMLKTPLICEFEEDIIQTNVVKSLFKKLKVI